VLDSALAAQPASATLRWLKAGELERAGDFEGAIAIYEKMYADDSNDVVVANNLASLITTHRTDAESLERAFAVARRLRGSDVPAFQDTYGWIEYRRGNLEEALRHLEPAAVGLPEDALTQFHLGMVYVGLDRTEDARRQLTRALELAGDSQLAQFRTARETLAALPPSP
jgi:Flp pilus assembly protein TadD